MGTGCLGRHSSEKFKLAYSREIGLEDINSANLVGNILMIFALPKTIIKPRKTSRTILSAPASHVKGYWLLVECPIPEVINHIIRLAANVATPTLKLSRGICRPKM